MISYIILFTFLLLIFSGKILFKRWFNNLSILSFVWMFLLFLYTQRLLPYFELKSLTWLFIILSFLAFLFGMLTVFAARKNFGLTSNVFEGENTLQIFSDGGKVLKIAILITGTIGLFTAIQNWILLFDKYGSLANILLNANTIYRLRVENEFEGTIPYLQVFSLIGIFLSGMYSAYKNRITLISFLPIIGYTLKSMAQFARIGMLIGLVCFVTSYILTRYYLSKSKAETRKFSFRNVTILLVVLVFIVLSALVVKSFRGTYERYKGADPALKSLSENLLISPSVYLYVSAHVGVFNEYLVQDKERSRFGETTFSAVYNLFSKFGLTERVDFDKKGYYIPMWTNSGTFLRDLHGDYGELGMFIVIYLLGMITTYLWFSFFSRGKLSTLVLLVFLMMIIELSFFSLVVGADYLLSLISLLILLPYLEKLAVRKIKTA